MIRVVSTDPNHVYKEHLCRLEFVEPTPEERAADLARWAEYERNAAVFERLVDDIYAKYRGQYVTIAGGELFVGPDHREVEARATAAHPDSRGRQFHRYIRRETGPVV